MSVNLLVGYQSFPSQKDITAKLTENNFTALHSSPLTLGLEFSAIGKKSIGQAQIRGTSLFSSMNKKEMTMQSVSISLQYGYDLLPKSPKTFLYPFVGLCYVNWTIFGQSTTGIKLSADRKLYDALLGIGLRHFLNNDLHGIFNNIDINLGTSIPLSNGKWVPFNDSDAALLQGTMKNTLTYYLTVTVGRGFRPAHY